ncbi:hypothetical protein ATANTOWER_000193 [Ataeniobius toweri]|uniref:Uncharacterized protein n=1 Tax=Ataeniobius toweri TaxID=208326 RepID=A0ABU7CGS7_9TELE|nr:hypothetical protein [Ataeniobius toweri]
MFKISLNSVKAHALSFIHWIYEFVLAGSHGGIIGGVLPGMVASPSQGNTETHWTNIHACTNSHQRKFLSNHTVVFLYLWEEAKVPGENPFMDWENLQTQCRKM